MKIIFTKATEAAICDVAQICAQDMEYKHAKDPAIMAETALDADRLKTFGYPEAHAEVRTLIDRHGYGAVDRAVRKFVPTA